jgi:aspartyl-tRNA(Asn)/glutamyl-tRNA(Gln) amidotransferase subunit C
MSLNKNDIKKISQLSRIKIEEGEHEQIADQLNSIMDWIDQLNAVDVSGIDLDCTNEKPMEERQDIVTDGNMVDAILANAPAAQHNMFAVPKVVE